MLLRPHESAYHPLYCGMLHAPPSPSDLDFQNRLEIRLPPPRPQRKNRGQILNTSVHQGHQPPLIRPKTQILGQALPKGMGMHLRDRSQSCYRHPTLVKLMIK